MDSTCLEVVHPDTNDSACSPAGTAVCKSVGDAPLGWFARRLRRKQLRENAHVQCGDVTGALENILNLSRLYADGHRSASLWWGRLHYLLGVPAAILATISGAAALDSDSVSSVPAVLALMAGGLSAATAFLKCETSRDRHNALSAGWGGLADEARMALLQYDLARPNIRMKSYIDLLVRLDGEKAALLSGALRAGPEPTNSRLHQSKVPQRIAGIDSALGG